MNRHLILEDRKLFNGLEISDNLGVMNWFEAVELCKSLGKGWRLPTKDELNMFYENKEEIGSFANNYYWSSTEADGSNAWNQGFGSGNQDYDNKNSNNYVSAVRTF
jgi:formylglycine-generating enzyme required for sulfatase activity